MNVMIKLLLLLAIIGAVCAVIVAIVAFVWICKTIIAGKKGAAK